MPIEGFGKMIRMEMSTGPLLIGYARCSTEHQDLEAQREQLVQLGVSEDRIYSDHGVSGTTADRPGLQRALAACRAGDTLVVTKLDRLARSVRDAQALLEDLTARGVAVSIGGTVHNPDDPLSKFLVNALAMVAEFERDLLSQRTREGLAVAKRKGKLRGKRPKLSERQEKAMLELYSHGEHTIAEICEMYQITRSTYQRAKVRAAKRAAVGK